MLLRIFHTKRNQATTVQLGTRKITLRDTILRRNDCSMRRDPTFECLAEWLRCWGRWGGPKFDQVNKATQKENICKLIPEAIVPGFYAFKGVHSKTVNC